MKKNRTLNSKLDHARPNLKLVSPLVYRICQGFVGTNLSIAFYFFFITTNFKNVPLAVTQGFLGFSAWGVIYAVIAAVLAYSLYKNNWKLTRLSLQVDLAAKLMWTFSLVFLVSTGYSVFGIMILWLFLAWTQAWSVVHFLPVVNWDGFGGDSDDKR